MIVLQFRSFLTQRRKEVAKYAKFKSELILFCIFFIQPSLRIIRVIRGYLFFALSANSAFNNYSKLFFKYIFSFFHKTFTNTLKHIRSDADVEAKIGMLGSFCFKCIIISYGYHKHRFISHRDLYAHFRRSTKVPV